MLGSKLSLHRLLGAMLVGIFALSSPANAQTRGIVCTFSGGVVTDLDTSPEPEPSHDAPLLLIFRNIDFTQSSAVIIGNLAPEGVPVFAVEGANGFSFVETTPVGNINTTTIFPVERGSPAPAVHSRHITFGGTPIISQLFGTCRQD